MKVLIAEDDGFFRKMLEQLLAPDYEVSTVEDGIKAWDRLQEDDPPRLALVDYLMPGLTGPQICRNARSHARTEAIYLIVLTAKNSIPEIAAALRAGADDYLTKPYHPEEVRAHLRVGRRVIGLQSALESQKNTLEEALRREQFLQQLLAICPKCGARRAESNYWKEVEAYIRTTALSCGTCPQCTGRKTSDAVAGAAGARR